MNGLRQPFMSPHGSNVNMNGPRPYMGQQGPRPFMAPQRPNMNDPRAFAQPNSSNITNNMTPYPQQQLYQSMPQAMPMPMPMPMPQPMPVIVEKGSNLNSLINLLVF
jgi:hypothetical protein